MGSLNSVPWCQLSEPVAAPSEESVEAIINSTDTVGKPASQNESTMVTI